MPTEGSCVIAIDFGTSRSAYAYAFVGNATTIYCDVPPNAVLGNGVQLKAETSLVLDEAHKAIAFGNKGRGDVYLANEQQAGKKRQLYLFQWFKMNLKDITSDNDTSVMATDHKGLKVPLLTVISEALSLMSKAALEKVATIAGRRYTSSEVYWIITVPAIWSPAASGFMRRAAVQAKMVNSLLSQKLTLVKEPEGALLDLLYNIDTKEVPLQLPVGAEMVVLDCGGGTNDMTFVRFESLNPLRVSEVKPASGGSAGASRVDKFFRKLVEDLFGTHLYDKIKILSDMIRLMDDWEQVKIGFDGDQTFNLHIGQLLDELSERYPRETVDSKALDQAVGRINSTLTSAEAVVKNRNRFTITGQLIRKWFDSIIDEIIIDLRKDLQDPRCHNVKFLYLVGGFCANKYLVERVSKWVAANMSNRGMKVVECRAPDLAIVKGAVLSLMRSSVKPSHHVAPYCYGLSSLRAYDASIHKYEKSYIASDKVRRVEVFVLYVKQNERIPLNYVTPSRTFSPLTASQTGVTLELYTVSDPDVTENTVVYLDDSRVKKLVTLDVDLDMSQDYDDREVDVSIKFGMETQIIAKNNQGKHYDSVSAVYYAN